MCKRAFHSQDCGLISKRPYIPSPMECTRHHVDVGKAAGLKPLSAHRSANPPRGYVVTTSIFEAPNYPPALVILKVSFAYRECNADGCL